MTKIRNYVTKIRNIGLGDYGMIINWDFCLKFSGAGLFCCSRGGLFEEFNLEWRRLGGKADPLHSATTPSSTQESQPVSGTSSLNNLLTQISRATFIYAEFCRK